MVDLRPEHSPEIPGNELPGNPDGGAGYGLATEEQLHEPADGAWGVEAGGTQVTAPDDLFTGEGDGSPSEGAPDTEDQERTSPFATEPEATGEKPEPAASTAGTVESDQEGAGAGTESIGTVTTGQDAAPGEQTVRDSAPAQELGGAAVGPSVETAPGSEQNAESEAQRSNEQGRGVGAHPEDQAPDQAPGREGTDLGEQAADGEQAATTGDSGEEHGGKVEGEEGGGEVAVQRVLKRVAEIDAMTPEEQAALLDDDQELNTDNADKRHEDNPDDDPASQGEGAHGAAAGVPGTPEENTAGPETQAGFGNNDGGNRPPRDLGAADGDDDLSRAFEETLRGGFASDHRETDITKERYLRLDELMDPDNPTNVTWIVPPGMTQLDPSNIRVNMQALQKAMTKAGITGRLNIGIMNFGEVTSEENEPFLLPEDEGPATQYERFADPKRPEYGGLVYPHASDNFSQEELIASRLQGAVNVAIDAGPFQDAVDLDYLRQPNSDHPDAYNRAFAARADYLIKQALMDVKLHYYPPDRQHRVQRLRNSFKTGLFTLQLELGDMLVRAVPSYDEEAAGVLKRPWYND